MHRVGQAILVTVLSAFLVAGRAHIMSAVTSLTASKSRRRTVRATLTSAADLAGCHLRRTLVVSVGHGIVVVAVTAAYGLQAGLVLGGWAALVAVVPVLGGPAAWGPTIVLASTELSRPALVSLVVVAIAAVVADRLARRRFVDDVCLRVGPLVTGAALAAGVAAGGVAGATVALFAATALAAVVVRHDTSVTGALAQFADDGAGPEPLVPVEAGATHGTRATLSVRVSWRTCVLVGALVVTLAGVRLGFARTGPTVVWVVVGLIVAVGLDRPVSWVQRRTRWPRALVVATLGLLAAGTIVSLAAISAPQATRSSTSLVEDAPEVVRSLQSLPIIGPRLEDADAARRVEEAIGDLPDRVARSGLVDRIGSLAGDGLVGAFWTLVIVLSALLDGPRVVARAATELPARYRRQAVRLGRAGQMAVARYAAGSAFVAALNGLMVGIGAFALGVPLAPALAAWAMAWNFVPQIGGFVGGVPFVALAFSQSPISGVVAFVGFVIYQNIENHLIQPAVVGRAVDLPAWLALVAALVGAAIGGLVGAVLAVPVLGAVKVMHREWKREDFPGTTAPDRRARAAPAPDPVPVGGGQWN
jgi:predicted PurR-regulated permease PerM